MKFPKEETYEILTTTIIEYCNATLFPILVKGKVEVHCVRSKDLDFNAKVETTDGIKYQITLNDGIFKTLFEVINELDNDIIDEEIKILSDLLLGSRAHKNEIYKSIAYSATFFVVLHELAHILRQHFSYIMKSQGKVGKAAFQEVDKENFNLKDDDSEVYFQKKFIKLAELDADASSTMLLLGLSRELFAETSEAYDLKHPNWREEPDNPEHRLGANQIMLYAVSLGLSIIETERGISFRYPSPFTRILNVFDVFNQEVLKSHHLLSDDSSEVSNLAVDDKFLKLMEEIVIPTFQNSIDIIYESCLIKNYDLSAKYHLEEIDISDNFLSDYVQLLIQLEPKELRTKEGREYKELRMYRPKFNEIFTAFISKSLDKKDKHSAGD